MKGIEDENLIFPPTFYFFFLNFGADGIFLFFFFKLPTDFPLSASFLPFYFFPSSRPSNPVIKFFLFRFLFEFLTKFSSHHFSYHRFAWKITICQRFAAIFLFILLILIIVIVIIYSFGTDFFHAFAITSLKFHFPP